MPLLYTYSLVPVLSVAALLCLTALFYGQRARGLAAFCGSIAFWSATLLMVSTGALAGLGRALAASGAFVVATYLHAAHEQLELRAGPLVWLAYGVAALLTVVGALVPGLLYDPVSLQAGPLFWPALALAVVGGLPPIARLIWSARVERAATSQPLRGGAGLLAAAGALCYLGAWSNAFLLAHGHPLPYGMFAVLASLLLLASLVRARQPPEERRLLERSLVASAIAAFLSAGFLFGVMALLQDESLSPAVVRGGKGGFGLGALFLLCMAALAFEPLRHRLHEGLGKRLAPDHAAAKELARALVAQRERRDQAERLAELGVFTSAIAHEVRNPLGVLTAQLRVLEMGGADAEQVAEMRGQIERASAFVDDLLSYGRPRPLELRQVDLGATLELALSSARQSLGAHCPEALEVEIGRPEGPMVVEADQGQILQVLIILAENAILALRHVDEPRLWFRVAPMPRGGARIEVEDNGPGIPPELQGRIFEPFVTGRKRDEASGTGLGLAIARRIVEHHGGRIEVQVPDGGGARFVLELPAAPPLIDQRCQEEDEVVC